MLTEKATKKKITKKFTVKTLNKEELLLLKKNVYPVWEQLKKKRTSKLQKELAEMLTQTGNDLNNENYISLGKSLKKALDEFNIEKIDLIINELAELNILG